MHDVNTDVLIIGGGPTGMVAGLCLGQYGISSLIVERHPAIQTHPKAHELSGRSIEILQNLGIAYADLAREASPDDDASRILFCETLDKEFGCIDLKALAGAAKYRRHLSFPTGYLNVSQVEVERVILQQIEASPHARLRYSQQWESFDEAGDVISSQITDLGSGTSYHVRSSFVICADGAGSRSRAALGINMQGPEKLRDFVSAYFEADLSSIVKTRGKLYFVFTPDAPAALVAHHIEKRWVFHAIVSTPHEKVESFTPEVLKQKIRTALGRPDFEPDIKSISPWRMTAQLAESYSRGRIFLAGDAAHRFPPTGGLGMNTGIGDAHNLAWKLALVIKKSAPTELLDSYEQERRPVARINCDESRTNYERMSEILDAFGLKADAADVLAETMNTGLVASLPAIGQSFIRKQLHRHGARALARFHSDPDVAEKVHAAIAHQEPHFDRIGLDLGLTYDEGAMLDDGSSPPANPDPVSEYIPSTRPGARFPHFWLDGRNKTQSSHQWIDYSRTTLVLGSALAQSAQWLVLEKLAIALGSRLVTTTDPPISPAFSAAVENFCQIEADGALLIRPDGYIGWRQVRAVRLTPALLMSVLQEILVQPKFVSLAPDSVAGTP